MMRFGLPVTRLLLGALAVANLPAFGWQDTNSRAPSLIPAVDHVSPAVRVARNDLYAPMVQAHPALSPGAPPPTTTVHGTLQPELPVAKSQVIVVGKVVSINPWFITGNKGLYSEYRVAVTSVLMNRSGWRQDTTLDVVEIGGSAQIPNIGTVADRVSGLGQQIETGRAYLLFLNYQPTAECFTFVKTWDVDTGQAIAVANDELLRVKQRTSTVSGLPLENLIAKVQALVDALDK
jgi:hypothetical protein